MYCIKCGKPNPDYAKFCAFCGNKLIEADAVAPPEGPGPSEPRGAASPIEPEPAAENRADSKSAGDPQPKKPRVRDPHLPYKRPADGASVRPLDENPAQPRGGVKPKSGASPDATSTPGLHADPPRPKKPDGVITSSGKRIRPPERTPNVKKDKDRFKDVRPRPASASPYRQARQQDKMPKPDPDDDLFFDDLDADNFYQDGDDEDRLAIRLRRIIAVLFVVVVISALSWLFFSESGQLFRAGLGIGAPASAYKTLGDQALSKGHLQSAAEAYYKALQYDSTNYEYSMLVGRAYEQLGNADRASQAYQKCNALSPDNPEPYRLLGELELRRGNQELGEQWLRHGYEVTGDASLISSLPTPTPVPALQLPSLDDIPIDASGFVPAG